MRRWERNGTGNGSLIAGVVVRTWSGLVWFGTDADGLRLAVGKSVEEGPVAGAARAFGSKFDWLGQAGSGLGLGFGFGLRELGQAGRGGGPAEYQASQQPSKPSLLRLSSCGWAGGLVGPDC
jgi:hypothetical protein